MLPTIDGFRLERSLEPDHPRCTISDPVYAAVDERTGQRVAVKVLHLGFPLRPESAARFLAAMRAVEQVRSPHVVRVLGAGFTADPGAPWFAMELLDGESLDARLSRGERFALRDAATILEQVVAVLGAANAAGVVTTHLATEHVMILPSRGLVAWHLGLGAWRQWAHELVQGTYTGLGHVRFHPDLTPDEAKGLASRPSNGAAALALLAFRLLAGRHYWHAANAADANPMQLLLEVMGAIEPPRARTPHELPPGFDAWFEACVTGRVADAAAALRALAL